MNYAIQAAAPYSSREIIIKKERQLSITRMP
jgi:hypothetical protein